jgi:hypothetical protein
MAAFDSNSSADDVVPVILSDSADGPIFRAIRSNSAGVLKVYTRHGGANVRTLRFLAGERQDVIIKRVLATGTTIPQADLDGYL